MFEEELKKIASGAKKKTIILKNSPLRYTLMAALAGMYICMAVMLSYLLGATLHDAGSPMYKAVMALSFGIALCLIVYGGVELFTSNNLSMTVGALRKETTWKDAIAIWLLCWIGNLLGVIITSFFLAKSGVVSDSLGEFFASYVENKSALTPMEMIIRGVFCNVMVCFASWCTYKLKNEAAQIMIILWSVFTFFAIGFEHSIANMGLFALAKMVPAGANIAMSGIVKNLIFVTIGNMIGGAVILGGSFTYFSKEKGTSLNK